MIAECKRAPFALATTAVVALVVGSACSAKKDPARTGAAARPPLVFAVDVTPVEAKKVAYVVEAPGTVDAFERVQVTARVAGVVDHVLFTDGQEVTKGKPLVVIENERYGLAVAQAKAAVDKAVAMQSDAEGMVARREGATVDHPGLITSEEIATNKTKVLTAKADAELARQALRVAEVNLRDSSVVAPMDGIIQTRTVETGQYVQPGYVMATLLRSDPMLLRFQVEPEDAPRIEPGMTATFTLRETPRTFAAKITLVSASADAATHMVSVTGEVQEQQHRYWLRPGSFCDVHVEIGADREIPIVPRSAARATDHGYVAYVIEGDVAKERPITLGMSTKDGAVEVRSGLKAGDLLVIRGAEPLSTGARVRASRVTATTPEGEAAGPVHTGADGGGVTGGTVTGKRAGGGVIPATATGAGAH